MDFARDNYGKISDSILSVYGRRQLKSLQGTKLWFSDMTLTIKGMHLVDEKGKVISKIKSDRMVNKILFRIM